MTGTQKTGLALVALGVLISAAALYLTENLTPELGLRWNLEKVEVVLQLEVDETMMDLAGFRERYPQYDDLSDDEVALRVRARYFDKMPEAEFDRAFIVPEARQPAGGKPGGDPVMIRGDLADIRPTDPLTRSVYVSDAIDYGLLALEVKRTAFPLRYALFAALGLLAAGFILMASSRKR
ncbi:MAG: hypothetical protein P8Y77_02920 [Nitrospirota bacterium]|jgi:hypothetical protein